MFCRYCGKRLDENLKYCPFCGAEQTKETTSADVFDTPVQQNQNQPATKKSEDGNTLAIAGFILAFFMPIAGIICSWLGLKKANEEGLPYGGLAKAGLIVSIVSIVLSVLTVIISVVIVIAAMGLVRPVVLRPVLCDKRDKSAVRAVRFLSPRLFGGFCDSDGICTKPLRRLLYKAGEIL